MEKILISSAFPEGHSPKCYSKVHNLLQVQYKVQEIIIRNFQEQDLPEIMQLHKQWFPLDYGSDFFNRIKNRYVICKIAEASIKQHNEINKTIVGILVYNHTPIASADILKIQKWSQYLYWDHTCIYIMTLGVIDQFRSLGIGKKLINVLFKQSEQDNTIKYIHLHMVAYNSAYKFYQKNEFQVIQMLYNHYDNIKGKPQDAKHYCRFFNEGKRRVGWIQWIKSWIQKKQIKNKQII